MTSCLEHIVYISLNEHIFAICKDNLFKFSVIVHNSLVFHSVKISHFLLFLRSLLSDLGPIYTCKHVICHAGLISIRTSVKAMYGVCILLWGAFPQKTLNCDKAIPQM